MGLVRNAHPTCVLTASRRQVRQKPAGGLAREQRPVAVTRAGALWPGLRHPASGCLAGTINIRPQRPLSSPVPLRMLNPKASRGARGRALCWPEPPSQRRPGAPCRRRHPARSALTAAVQVSRTQIVRG